MKREQSEIKQEYDLTESINDILLNQEFEELTFLYYQDKAKKQYDSERIQILNELLKQLKKKNIRIPNDTENLESYIELLKEKLNHVKL